MARLIRKKPCNDCPFRTNSTRGWLGADTPRGFIRTTLAEDELPCHLDVDYSDPDWLETQMPSVSFCAGSLIFFRNMLKRPKNPTLAEATKGVERSDNVFRSPREFLEHHVIDGVTELEPAHPYDEWLGVPDIGTDGTELPEDDNE